MPKFIDPFAGLIGQGTFVGDETATLYKSYVYWFEEPQVWGLVVEEAVDPETGETGYKFKQPYEWDTVTINYYLGNESQAPRHTMVKAPVQNLKALDKPMKLNNNSKVLLKK